MLIILQLLSLVETTCVAISTYSMVSYTQKRAWDSQQVWVHDDGKYPSPFVTCTGT